MKKKSKEIHIRINEDTANYIDTAISFHDCSKTEFITKQILRPEYYEVKFDDVKELIRLFSNLTNNMNQIARTLNSFKLRNEIISEKTIEEIKNKQNEIEKELGLHDKALQEQVMKFYRVSKNKKIRPIGNMGKNDFDDLGEVETDEEEKIKAGMKCNGNS